MKTKTSYGIALARYNKNANNNVEILLIKKRYTYHFFELVMAHYKKGDTKYIKHMFDNMSYSEKMDIMSMQFSRMWHRIYFSDPERFYNIVDVYKNANFANTPIEQRHSESEQYKIYIEKKNKFEKSFLKDGGKKIRTLINQSIDSKVIWEMPKGGKNANESNIECAIREFYEETSIKSSKYMILYDVPPLVDSFVDNDIIYKTVYYMATLREGNDNFKPYINYRNFSQVTEVEEIKWVSLAEIKFFDMPSFMNNRLITLYKKIIKIFKNKNKFSKSLI
jgi:8-oxo-dGTP pyrophosphatase MutT (NUDIX family)